MREKLERIIFYLFLFAIPFEKRIIFARWTYPFNEWTAGYIYGTDILILALFVFWLARAATSMSIKEAGQTILKTFKPRLQNPSLWLVVFFIVSALSIFNSKIVSLSVYQLIKLAEFILLYFYLKSGFGKIYKFRNALIIIMASGLFQAIIGILQFVKQSSIGLGLLGESPIAVDAANVAVFIVDSQKYLRAYGTMPHPNVIAAWLFLAIFAFYNFYFYPHTKRGLVESRAEGADPRYGVGVYPSGSLSWRKHLLLSAAYVIMLLGLFFTFSRVIIGLWALGSVFRLLLLFFKKDFRDFFASIRQRLIAVFLITIAVITIFAALYWPLVQSRLHISAGEEAVTQRIFYDKIAGLVAVSHPLFGIGIGQFVARIMDMFGQITPTIYQPVHNIYLLIAGETGFAGILAFLLFLFFIFYNFIKNTKLSRPYHFSFLILAGSFLVSGLFDHFLWTLQQGSLILWMTLALISLNPDLG